MSVVTHETTPGWRLFIGFLADAPQRGVPLVLLRPRGRDAATALSGGDYDFLMSPSGFPALVELLWRRAAAEGASFSIHWSKRQKIQVLIHLPEAGRSITLEFWTRLEVRDPGRRSAAWVAWDAVAPLLQRDADGEARLPPEVEIACYLSHLATQRKRTDAPLVVERLAGYAALAAREAPSMVPLLAGLPAAGIPATAARANARLRALGVLAPRTPVGAVFERLRDKARALPWKWRQRFRRRGRIIVVTGADGVGKSTVIEHWDGALKGGLRARKFKNLFRHHPLYRPFYYGRSAIDRRRGVARPRNAFDEAYAGVMFRLARQSWVVFRMLVMVAGRRCLDRGFPDLLFSGLRGEEPAGLRPDWAALAARMPQPDWHVHLDAPDAVIRARKRELSEEALPRYRDGMARIVGTAPAGAFSRVDTGGTLDAVMGSLRLAAACHGIRMRWREPGEPGEN